MIKRIACILAAAMLLIGSSALADDRKMSDMSVEELVTIHTLSQHYLFNHPDLKRVLVPAGTYKIGDEIPAGHWTIIAPDEIATIHVIYGTAVDQFGNIDVYKPQTNCLIYGSKSYVYRVGNPTEVDYVLEKGKYIQLSSGAYFQVYAGHKFSFE